jgi:hypothetical protein
MQIVWKWVNAVEAKYIQNVLSYNYPLTSRLRKIV